MRTDRSPREMSKGWRWLPLPMVLLGFMFGSSCKNPSAQTVFMVEGNGPTVLETAGPPGGPCAYPNGPIIDSWPADVPFGCATVGPFPLPPGILGDVAVDKILDLVWVTGECEVLGSGPTYCG